MAKKKTNEQVVKDVLNQLASGLKSGQIGQVIGVGESATMTLGANGSTNMTGDLTKLTPEDLKNMAQGKQGPAGTTTEDAEKETARKEAAVAKMKTRGNRGMTPLTNKDYKCRTCGKTKEELCDCDNEDWDLYDEDCPADEKVGGAIDLLRSKIAQMTDWEIKKQDINEAIDDCFKTHKQK